LCGRERRRQTKRRQHVAVGSACGLASRTGRQASGFDPGRNCRRYAPGALAAHPLDRRRLLIEKITDHLQQRLKPHALPQQFEIGKAHLPRRRSRHGSTQPAENRQAKANPSAAHPAADDIDRLFGVAANHLSNEMTSRLPLASKTCRRKPRKCRFCHAISPFATETSLVPRERACPEAGLELTYINETHFSDPYFDFLANDEPAKMKGMISCRL
jgi:hypothetical protein